MVFKIKFCFGSFEKGGFIMSYNDNHYRKEEDGDYYSQAEAEKAYENGHLEKLSNGSFYDRETGEEYWPDGTKK